MEPEALALTVMALALGLLVLRVPIAFSLGFAASLGLFLFFSWRPGGEFMPERGVVPTLSLIGSTTFNFVHNFPLSMIPLFIGLGHVSYHARITTDLYDALSVWLGRLRGGLAMSSILGCGGFSAITGSSVACASAMGRIAVPEMLRFGYSPRLAAGAVAAGGTLGSLVPPSLLFVIYAIFTEQSVRNLFLAGILPGILSLVGFIVTVLIWVRLAPGAAPASDRTATRREKAAALGKLWPVVFLLVLIVGGIYMGYFTPTEAAAVSFVSAVLIGVGRRTLTWSSFWSALEITVRQSAMIFLIAVAAKLLVSFISLTRITPEILAWLQATGASPVLIILGLALFYLVIGMFLDSIGILVLTLPFTVPLVAGYGMDLVWFGVVVVKLLEIGLITPPIGLNVFVVQACSPQSVKLEHVFQGVGLFLFLDLVVLGLILAYPQLSLLIPAAAG